VAKILHAASINKPSDMTHDETSYWSDERIQTISCDVHFSVGDREGKLLSEFRARTFS
jgi:hypothetical protein